MKLKIVILLLGLLILTTGCSSSSYKNTTVYLDMGTICDKVDNPQDKCDNLCENSNLRIIGYKAENKVILDNSQYICKCY